MPFHRLAATVAAVMLFAAAPAGAHEYKIGDLKIGHPWSRATPAGGKVGGGFLTITNTGQIPDRLVGVSASFAQKTEIHESLEEDGVAKMREIEAGVEIKPGETVTFTPGAKHLMFVGLGAPLAKGEKVKGELIFEKAGKIAVEFAVEAAGGKPMEDHKHPM